MSHSEAYMKTSNTPINKKDQPWRARWNTKFDVDTKRMAEWKTIEAPITVPASVIDLPPESNSAVADWWKKTGQGVLDSIDFAEIERREVTARPLPIPAAKRQMQPRHRTGYLDRVYDPKEFSRTVDETLEMMREHAADFDAIAFRGSSGAALAFIAAHQLDRPLIHIRKDKGHYGSRMEGFLGATKIAIVDDFVASGDTIREIVSEVVDSYDTAGYVEPVFTHLFLYSCGLSTQEGQIRGALGECSDSMAIHLAYDRNRF
jgi:hypothetical protein